MSDRTASEAPVISEAPSGKLIAADFTPEQLAKFTICKEILWQSETATREEINAKEREFILALRSNDPTIGYNRWPKFRAPGES